MQQLWQKKTTKLCVVQRIGAKIINTGKYHNQLEWPGKMEFASGPPSECLLSLNLQAAVVRTLALNYKNLGPTTDELCDLGQVMLPLWSSNLDVWAPICKMRKMISFSS